MRINSNISALNAWKNLSATDVNLGKSLAKLSSGLRISKAADDAAGLAISEKMRGQVRGLNTAMRNSQDGISLLQTAEGALNEVHGILQRMRELAVQASSDTLTDSDRSQLQVEVTQLISEINGIADRTQFNTQVLLKGTVGVKVDTTAGSYAAFDAAGVSFDVAGAKASTTYTFTYVDGATELTLAGGGVSETITISGNNIAAGTTLRFEKLGINMTFSEAADLNAAGLGVNTKTLVTTASAAAAIQIGANSGQTMSISISDMQAAALGVDSVSVATKTGANSAIATVDDAITEVSNERATLGAYQNRLEYTIANLASAAENMTASESRIRDVDMALEMANFTRNQILLQSGTAMLAQANMKPQAVLQLLG